MPDCDIQEEQIYALAADCSIGSAGSAILMTHSRTAQKEPALIYLKVKFSMVDYSKVGGNLLMSMSKREQNLVKYSPST